ncbi:S-layer homology domain-containing protein [Virgibacillus sp. FSP13]
MSRRSVVIFVVVCMMCFMSIPPHFSAQAGSGDSDVEAEKSENAETSKEEIESEEEEEYNELGIKKGTEVYGVDISKFSEEELQYVPEGWRDGVIENEQHHAIPKARSLMRAQKAYPNVNDYILSHNLPTAAVEYDHISKLPQFGYRYGRPEGVVAHETANNSSTITQEITYMKRNYQNAFVHAYVDNSRVIEVHPTKYASWGAGPYANERFIHVELVRVHSFDKFARSINNYANYIASLLDKYGLQVISAEDNNGKGTLWSHRAVTHYLGGTWHVDPHGYFAQWGYNWSDFVELVTMKYNALTIQKQSTSKVGHIKSEKDFIYNDLAELQDYKLAGSEYTDRVFYIKQQAKMNGQTYYLISEKPSSTKGTIGWVNSNDIKVYSHTSVDRKQKTLTLSGSGVAYNRAWGDKKNIVYPELSQYAGETFDVNLTEKVGDNVWYRGHLHGKQVWIHENHFEIKFTDVPKGSSHYESIYALANMEAIRGYRLDDGSYIYRPGKELSRSHAAVMFTKALKLPVPNDVAGVLENFSDIDTSHLYAEEIAATYQAGIFQGSEGKFMDKALTREQMATVIAEAFDLQETGVDTGVRLDNVSPAHQDSVSLLAQHGITVELDNYRPFETVTRGQFATFLYKAMQESNK